MIICLDNKEVLNYLKDYLKQRLELDYQISTTNDLKKEMEEHDGLLVDHPVSIDCYQAMLELQYDVHENALNIIKKAGLMKEIEVDKDISLYPYYPCYDVTFPWYQDIQLVIQCDNKKEPYSLESLKMMYNYLSQRGYCYYIRKNEELIGDVTLQDDGEISIVIARNYQNQHIGRKVINKIIEIAKEKEFERVYAHIFSFNRQSQRVFEACNFKQIDQEHYEYWVNNMKVKKVGIVSLSAGTIGEDFVKHELEIGIRRLIEYGLEVSFMTNSLKGIEYLKNNPSKRADDFLEAYKQDNDMILCAIGGEDTYRLLPYLFENDELAKVCDKRIFLGFSDSTVNHLMLNKLGIKSFYGQSFLADVCEIGNTMLEYTESYFHELITTGTIKEIRPAECWFESRKDYSAKAIGTSLASHPSQGFVLLQGPGVFKGKILGGCLDTIYDLLDNANFPDSKQLAEKYEIFPKKEQWKDKILLLETSEVKASPELYRKMLERLKETGIFEVINGLIVGKPCDNVYYQEYKDILLEIIDDKRLPILYNVNVGHCLPRCIIPLNVQCVVDFPNQVIKFQE